MSFYNTSILVPFSELDGANGARSENETPDTKAMTSKSEDDHVDEDEITCNICFEPWSNTGRHRISSLKCGHFFGLACIEKWLNSTSGNDCPTCNEKASKKDIRNHYVAKLKAVDTGDRDRALEQVEALKKDLRKIDLDYKTIKVDHHLLKEENEKLKNEIKALKAGGAVAINGSLAGPSYSSAADSSSKSGNAERLAYVRTLQIMRSTEQVDNNRSCRVMAYNPLLGMLVLSQPSFTALAPGFGVRRVHMLDQKLETFVVLHKDGIRDLAFSPVNQDQLLSVSLDKTMRITNISSCVEVVRFSHEFELWSCTWHAHDPNRFFAGSKRGEILLYDTRNVDGFQAQLEFPIQEQRPIIALEFVPKCDNHRTFPCSGLLAMTLGSVWFFEEHASAADGSATYVPHKLQLDGLFWSMRFGEALEHLTIMLHTKVRGSGT